MNSALKVVLGLAVLVFLSTAAMLMYVMVARPQGQGEMLASQRSADPLKPDPMVADLSLPQFEKTNQDGQTVTSDIFSGKLTIVDFIFTNCPLVCPMMTGTMADLGERLKRHPQVQFLSISVDPERDTPEQLKRFGEIYDADFSRWTFARGERESTWRMVREGLMFAIGDDESLIITLPDGSTMLNIRHPSHFVLVGPDGRVLGLYSATDEAAVRALESRARQGAQRLAKG